MAETSANTPPLAVTDPSARDPKGNRYVLGFATCEAGSRRVLTKWLKRPVKRARLTRVGDPARRQWVEHA